MINAEKVLLVGLLGVLSYGALPASASANFDGTYIINPTNFYNCTGNDCGTVSISGDGTTALTVTVSVTEANLDIHGVTTTIALNLASSVGPFSVSFDTPPTDGGTWSTTVQTGVGNMDGFGSFDVGINCNGPTGGNHCGDVVKFTLTSASAETLTLNNKNNFFAMKLTGNSLTDPLLKCVQAQTTCDGFTGFATLTLTAIPGPIVGAGLPGLVAACGALCALARRRKLA